MDNKPEFVDYSDAVREIIGSFYQPTDDGSLDFEFKTTAELVTMIQNHTGTTLDPVLITTTLREMNFAVVKVNDKLFWVMAPR